MEHQVEEITSLKNDEVEFTINHKPACIVEFKIKATPKLVSSAHKEAVKSVIKEVSLPGFRKGKAPEALVLKKFGHDIDRQWQKIIADYAFRSCQKLSKLPLLNNESRISYSVSSHSLDNGAELVLSFETEPKLPEIDASTITLKNVEKPVVNEDKVKETIRQIQMFFAEWESINDRPIQEGDFVTLDVDVTEEDPAQRLFSNTRFEVKPASMAKWMYDLVLGRSKGDSVDGVSQPDEDANEKDKAELKPKKVKVTIKSVESAKLPELSADFVAKLGVSSVEELHSNIQKLLEKQAADHVKRELRDQVHEILLKDFSFDLPRTLVSKEVEFRLRQLSQDPEFQKYWETLPAEERKNIFQNIEMQSEKAVRMFYLSRKILADAKLNVSPEDLQPSGNSPLEILLDPQTHLMQYKNPEKFQAEAFSRLILEKAADHIAAHAKVG